MLPSHTSVVLNSFQRLTAVDRLKADGEIHGDWRYVDPGCRVGYQAMVEAMDRAGVNTQGRPPIWAWRGDLTLLDASMLLDPEHELALGYATVEFAAPTDLLVTSNYGAWNDFLAITLTGGTATWEIGVTDPTSWGPQQVCLPYLRKEWIRDIRPLPTDGWDDLDLSKPA